MDPDLLRAINGDDPTPKEGTKINVQRDLSREEGTVPGGHVYPAPHDSPVQFGALTIHAEKLDQRIADNLRIRVAQALYPVTKLMDEANGHGMTIQFAVQKNQQGRHFVPEVLIVKPL